MPKDPDEMKDDETYCCVFFHGQHSAQDTGDSGRNGQDGIYKESL